MMEPRVPPKADAFVYVREVVPQHLVVDAVDEVERQDGVAEVLADCLVYLPDMLLDRRQPMLCAARPYDTTDSRRAHPDTLVSKDAARSFGRLLYLLAAAAALLRLEAPRKGGRGPRRASLRDRGALAAVPAPAGDRRNRRMQLLISRWSKLQMIALGRAHKG